MFECNPDSRVVQRDGCLLVVSRTLVTLVSMLCLSNGMAAGSRVLEIGDSNEPPFTNAQRTGFFDVVAAEAFRRAGLGLRLVRLPAERGLLLADRGILDGELARVGGMQTRYPNLVQVGEKLFDRHYVAFSKIASMQASVDSIRVHSVGFVKGWRVFERAMQGASDVVAVDDIAQLFRLLERDRIEVALFSRWMGLEHIRKYRIEGVHELQPPLFVRDTFIYLHKGHTADATAIANALRAMKQDGAYLRAYRRNLLEYGAEVAQ